MNQISKIPFLGLKVSKKPRLVILGSGWAATSILKTLKPNLFDTIVISPFNYFLFTPLLPGATTGTVEYRSLLESTRKICKRSGADYIAASCRDIDLNAKSVSVQDKNGLYCDVKYDKLVIALGARNETYQIPGVKEYVNFCKSITDARKIRDRIMELFDQASFPSTTEQEKQRLMTFVIVGGGPTGVEFAAELYDFLNKELIQYFPDLVKRYVRVLLIQGADHVLNTFDEAISSYTEDRFKRQHIQVITNAFVRLVEKDSLLYEIKKGDGWQGHKTPYGICVWSTGISMHELTRNVSARIDPQTNSKALRVDHYLNVIGTKDVYALGDCSTIIQPKLSELLSKEKVNTSNLGVVLKKLLKEHPKPDLFVAKIDGIVKQFENGLSLEEVKVALDQVEGGTTTLPATAQVASQQGAYLGTVLNKLGKYDTSEWSKKQVDPFRYRHLGNFAYVGGKAAVLDLGKGHNVGGFGGFFLWRSAYLSKQVSFRTRVLLAWDWTKTILFGRDISKL